MECVYSICASLLRRKKEVGKHPNLTARRLRNAFRTANNAIICHQPEWWVLTVTHRLAHLPKARITGSRSLPASVIS
jgi:hypothetical protein